MIINVFFFYLLLGQLNLFKSKTLNLTVTLFFAISPWLVFNARLGYETTLAFLVFNVGLYGLSRSLVKPKAFPWAVFFLSLSTYISHNQRFLAPLLLLAFLVIFRKSFFQKTPRRVLVAAFILGLLTQLPNLWLIGTSAFWIKNVQFDLKYLGNFLKYLSPKTLFYDSTDIDLQHTLPNLSVMYDWMALFYLAGLFGLVKKLKEVNYKLVALCGAVTLCPAVFSGYFLSTQRSLAFAVPLAIIIGIGFKALTGCLRKRTVTVLIFIFLFLYSSIQLYTSYFVLFPRERANAWNYGYSQVADFIKAHPNSDFVFDDTRNPRAYILLLYFLGVSPIEYQKEVSSDYKKNYYAAPPPAVSYHFANVTVRPIDWKKDTTKGTFIIGDGLSVSETQAQEHHLTKAAEFMDLSGDTIFAVFRAEGELKESGFQTES
jgi:hypothetical protein